MQNGVGGHCHCGRVRYRATGTPECVDTCYCGDCTRAVGSPLTAWARFPAERFEWTAGEPVRFESSPGVVRTFCPGCGSSLTYHDPGGETLDVATATLDDPGALPPTTDGPGRPAWLPAPRGAAPHGGATRDG